LKGYRLWGMGQLDSTCRAPPRRPGCVWRARGRASRGAVVERVIIRRAKAVVGAIIFRRGWRDVDAVLGEQRLQVSDAHLGLSRARAQVCEKVRWVGLHSLPGVRLVTWTVPADIS
jgi:hypothetical protein